MTHLGEKHISESLEQHADDIHMRVTMMQSHLENSAVAMAQMKMIAQTRMTPAVDGSKEEEDMQSFFRKIESLTMQARSAKVIAGKALNQLEELKSRALILGYSTLPAVEHCQNSASELATSTREVAMILAKLVNEEGRTTPLTYQEISNAISSNSTTLSSISSMIQATATLIQNFYNIAGSLNQTVEFESPPPPTPWQQLAEKLRKSSAISAMYKSEVGRLKDDIVEKNTALAIREKIVEEMSVKVEVLEKRVGESGGRRERVRELEAFIESAEVKEKSLLSQLRRQQINLQELEVERDSWKKPAPSQNHTASDHHQIHQSPLTNHPATQNRITALESEIRCLHSAIRYLRSRAATNHRTTSKAFISVPLAGQKLPMTTEQIHKAEAAENLRELVHLLSEPESRLVSLRVSKKEDRLKWKPAKETTDYALATQRGEWNVWREWGESVGRQRRVEMTNGQRTVPILSSGKARKGVKREVLFEKDCSGFNHVAKPVWGGQVRILSSGNGSSETLSEMERLTGFGAGT